MGLETVRELFLFCFYLSVPLHPPLKGIAAFFSGGVSSIGGLHNNMIDLLHEWVVALTTLHSFGNKLPNSSLLCSLLDRA